MIHAGTVQVQLYHEPSGGVTIDTLAGLKEYAQEMDKVDLLIKLEQAKVILIANYKLNKACCTVFIDLFPDIDLGHSVHTFLELMLLVNCSLAPEQFKSVFGDTPIYQSVLDIFIHLPSPSESQSIENTVPGMKVTLYNYQKNAVCKMIQRESSPSIISPYEIVKMRDVNDQHYYLDQQTNHLSLITKPDVPDIQGGIICEDMGTGKTCICLATIMATKDDLSTVNYLPDLKTDMPIDCSNQGIQTLKSICAHTVMRLGIEWKSIKRDLPHDVVEWFTAFPMYYQWTDKPVIERSRRIELQLTTLTVYVSNATLVIVPDNLVAQWTGEIYKHINDEQLRFLVYDDSNQKLLSPIELVDYDLVLISQYRFSQENTLGGLDFKSQTCSCPVVSSTRREKACVCYLNQTQQYISPLLQIHWKRMIVDEGHRLVLKNRQSELSTKLFCQWRWVCTGTPTQNLTESVTVKTKSEKDDLTRLGIIFGQALHAEPFKSDKKAWSRWITKPVLEGKPWAISTLTEMMQRAMIRNQRQDIEKEVSLPPLYQKIVHLDFDYYQWIAHNCQIAMISLNAILSKREGADYLFSPKNFKSLRETVHHLWQSCLWFSVDIKLVQLAFENCVEKCIDVQQGRSDYGNENQDLERIKDVLQHALNDRMFVCIMSHHSPSYVVQGLPPLFRQTWGWLQGDHGAYRPTHALSWDDHCVIAADTMMDVLDHINKGDETLYVYDGTLKTRQIFDKQPPKEDSDAQQLTFYNRNAFSDARILSSSSVKINYLVNQIVRYQATEKCIIFSQHYNEMYEIYLALKLAKLRVLMYGERNMSNSKRSQMILTFNTSENANIIIMAVQKAAYGIDLSKATRVYFVSPVWQTAMEQQAIKRAHRIGQTKPVYIETLVIRNTIEDKLLQRRNQVSGEETSGEFFTDSKLKNILNHAIFVPLPNTITKAEDNAYYQKIDQLDTPLYFVPPSVISKRKRDELSEHQDVVMEDEPVKIKKKRRKVMFSDDISTAMDAPLSISPSLKSDTHAEEDLELEIVGDKDIMDAIQPWKLRLLQSEKRKNA